MLAYVGNGIKSKILVLDWLQIYVESYTILKWNKVENFQTIEKKLSFYLKRPTQSNDATHSQPDPVVKRSSYLTTFLLGCCFGVWGGEDITYLHLCTCLGHSCQYLNPRNTCIPFWNRQIKKQEYNSMQQSFWIYANYHPLIKWQLRFNPRL